MLGSALSVKVISQCKIHGNIYDNAQCPFPQRKDQVIILKTAERTLDQCYDSSRRRSPRNQRIEESVQVYNKICIKNSIEYKNDRQERKCIYKYSMNDAVKKRSAAGQYKYRQRKKHYHRNYSAGS